MGNKFYAPNEQRAAKVGELFDKIASRYDLINDLQSFGLHRFWKRRLVQLAAVSPGENVLDLCCGTGDLCFALAQRGARVTGLDFSAAMLAQAEKRREATRRLVPSGMVAQLPDFIRGDALQIPFPDNHCDLVTISYGLRNLAGVEAGLREINRVLKPGGRLLILDFGKPQNVFVRGIYFAYLKVCVPVFGRLFCGDPATHAYIFESLKRYPGQRGVDEVLRRIGLEQTVIYNLLGGIMSVNFARKPSLTGLVTPQRADTISSIKSRQVASAISRTS